MTTPATPYTGVLDTQQRARVEALKAARDVLVERKPAGPFASAATGAADPLDVVALARFVIDGEDPWRAPTTTQEA